MLLPKKIRKYHNSGIKNQERALNVLKEIPENAAY